jgi:hypothetical protein
MTVEETWLLLLAWFCLVCIVVISVTWKTPKIGRIIKKDYREGRRSLRDYE